MAAFPPDPRSSATVDAAAAARPFCFLLLLLLIPLLPLLLGCGTSEASQPPPRPLPTVVVAQPLQKQIVEWDRYIGRTAPVEEVDVQARVSGYLKSIEFTDGEIVEKGDLLFVIDPRPFESALARADAAVLQAKADQARASAAVTQAQAQFDQAQAAYSLAESRQVRGERLADRDAMTAEELDQRRSETDQADADRKAALASVELARSEVKVAEAAVISAESERRTAGIQLGYTRIVAPIGGRISRHMVSEGNLIAGGDGAPTLLTTIVAVDPVHVYFDVNEREFLKYVRLDRSGKRKGSREAKNPVFISLADEDGFPHEGHMDFVDNMVDRNTGTMRGRAIFRNDDQVLAGGLFVRVRLPGSAPYEAMLIPEKAVAVDQTQQIVYVVTDQRPEGTREEPEGGPPTAQPDPDAETMFVERRVVEVGPNALGLKVIRSGLDSGDRVIIEGLMGARPGAEVQVETTTIEAGEGDKLPSDYQPWPKEKWIRTPEPVADLPGPEFGGAESAPE